MTGSLVVCIHLGSSTCRILVQYVSDPALTVISINSQSFSQEDGIINNRNGLIDCYRNWFDIEEQAYHLLDSL